jgi:hypothetical protein
MQLREFSFTPAKIKPQELLLAIETVVAPEAVNQAIEQTRSLEQRNRVLPTHLVIGLVIAMSLWATDSIVDVLKNLVSGLSGQWIRMAARWKTPSKSSISEARLRVGCQVMSRLFELVARPMATPQTPGAFLQGLRLMAVDGTVFDLPDTEANAKVFGYPGTRSGTKAAFPKARLVFLAEAATHLICDALICPYRMGERVRAKKLLRSVGKGMLLMWDRGLHSYQMVNATRQRQCHLLGRVPANVKFEAVKVLDDGSYLSWIAPDRKSKTKGCGKIIVRVIEYTIEQSGQQQSYRLITDLTDISLFPALVLAKQYHQRWEAENTLDEFKTHLNARKVPLRSKTPRLVVQEIYGWLLGHWAVRCLMFQAAHHSQISPLHLSFTGSLRLIRRAVPQFQQAQPQELPLF